MLISSQQEGECTVLHEWDADGITPVGLGTRGKMPMAALAARGVRTIAVRNATKDARLADPSLGTHEIIDSGTLAGIATPMGLVQRTGGVLLIHQVGRERAWTSQEIRLLETVAHELRTALEAAQLLVALQRESERMLALHRASALVAAATDPSEVLAEILDAAGTLLGRGVAALYRWDAAAGVLRLAENVHAAPGTAAVIRPGQGAGGRAFESQQAVIVNDYASWPNAAPANVAAGWTAALSVPLVRAGQRLGVLTVGATDARIQFEDDDARLLGLFGDQAVAALTTAELVEQQRRAVEQLERLNAAKSDFVSIVSHEFRTPLTGIQGFSELIRDEDLTVAEMKEYAGDINTDAQRLNRMITEMLDLDRMESGKMTLRLVPADVNAIVREAAGRLGTSSPRHATVLHLDPELPLVEIDRDKIEQVVLNLLSNAVKYSPGGGDITITTRVEGDFVHVFVRDSGLGIPPESLEKVFERYSRLESGATRYIQGTGLGLPIARQIIEMHGGHAWVESTVGEGSVFQFTLPLVAVASA
ncbi:MAG: GAF domain-containing protein [Actinobacteria bacterium]|nr:GAF domain-containing protein [Actinomycetota bacterium]